MSKHELAIALLVPTTIVVVLHVLLLNAGQLVVYSTEFAGRSRSTLGFTNANQASSIYLSFVVVSIFTYILFSNRASLLLMAASYIIAFYVMLFTDTRTAMVAMTLLIVFQILGAIFRRNKEYAAILRILGASVPTLACGATYYLTTYKSSDLNIFLSGRPYFFSQFVRAATPYDFIFGWQPADAAGVDNVYLMLLSGVGVIGFLFIVIGYSYLIFCMESTFIPIVFVLLTTSVFESFLLRPEIPVSILFLHLILSGVARRLEHNIANSTRGT